MDYWTEIYTALCLGRSGTVSETAKELGVHRATVNRHIDTLEANLGAKLFIRHRLGYQPTELGQEFLAVATRAHGMLDDFIGLAQVRNAELEGEIIVTTLFPLTELILPGILEFRRHHPNTRVTVNTGDNLASLEKAEAHVALRVGPKPTHDDYVVQPFCTLDFVLVAHDSYIDRHGKPDPNNLSDHLFVGNPDSQSRAPFEAWLAQNVAPEQVVFCSANAKVIETAIFSGEGIGFMPLGYARSFSELHSVGPSMPEWRVESWLVTHVDVHRTDKIQSMLACLKAVTVQA